ncbi:MAG: SpoIID/LytB domain-containing protein [Clostridium sp.]|nr:SpoIID/LytB domain-containing protein [Clostridium sp.]
MKGEGMEKRARIWLKVVVAAVLTLLFIWLVYTDEKVLQLEQPEGELIWAEDVWILLKELKEAGAGAADEAEREETEVGKIGESELKELEQIFTAQETEYVSYENYCKALDILLESGGASEETKKLKERLTYKNKYKDEFYLLKKDWYESYEKLVKLYGLEEQIKETQVEILCGSQNLAGEEVIGEGCLLDKNGKIYATASGKLQGLQFVSVRAYVRENRMLTLVDTLSNKNTLPNVWIMEDEGERIYFFYKGYEITADIEEAFSAENLREQVGDISYAEGKISKIQVKGERIGGKLLGISEEQAEIEGYGKLPILDDCIGYQLYEELREADKEELALGYDFADFVLDKGKICAFLITRKETMETVRVAIKNNNFGSLYHDKITLAGENGITVAYGEYGARAQEKLEAGQELVIEPGSKYLSGGRAEVSSDVNTGKIRVLSLERSQGTPAYRGKMEIAQTEDGLVLINEVLMEEYLYSVVPSEMPSSYPMEALKAQAVCARTYGYRHLLQPGYGNLGAHMDDSVSYQVYNNIAENVNTTKAVKETAGTLLLYEGEPVTTYYYSTSCGFGADAGVWNSGQAEEFPYLRAGHIARGEESQGNGQEEEAGQSAEDGQKEEAGRSEEAAQSAEGEQKEKGGQKEETEQEGEGRLETEAGLEEEDDSGKENALKAENGSEKKVYSAAELSQEENFRDYIFNRDENAYEKDEKWFRWRYYVDELDEELLLKKLKERYGAVPSKILTLTEGGDAEEESAYEEKEPENFKEVYEIQCLKRREGGVMDELLLTTDKGVYKVVSEYNIRYVLNQGGEAAGQDGEVFACTTLLPSAYFAIDVVKGGTNVIGYTVIGGGYGHGVGMSQNGAKAMGADGMDCEGILSFYFNGCQLSKLY